MSSSLKHTLDGTNSLPPLAWDPAVPVESVAVGTPQSQLPPLEAPQNTVVTSTRTLQSLQSTSALQTESLILLTRDLFTVARSHDSSSQD